MKKECKMNEPTNCCHRCKETDFSPNIEAFEVCGQLTCDNCAEELFVEDDSLSQEHDCTCWMPMADAHDIDPPEMKRDKWCPTHGKDPDEERQRRIDRELDR